MRRLLTFGHGTAGRSELTALLQSVDAREVVDVRRFPGSRRNADVSTDAMAEWLPLGGIAYRWDPRLGGRRRLADADDPEADRWWRVTQFRAYAAHMRTEEFQAGLTDLLAGLGTTSDPPVLVMCSESLWWRCHRRLISDAVLLLHGVDVHHLGHDGRLSPHRPSAGARITPQGLRYDQEA